MIRLERFYQQPETLYFPVYSGYVRKIPDGGGPENIRRTWVGVHFDELVRKDPNIPEIDLLSCRVIIGRSGWMISRDIALATLRNLGYESEALWFEKNLPSHQKILSFGGNEIGNITRNRSLNARIDGGEIYYYT